MWFRFRAKLAIRLLQLAQRLAPDVDMKIDINIARASIRKQLFRKDHPR